MNVQVEAFLWVHDTKWRVDFHPHGVAWSVGDVTLHWVGEAHRERAVEMLRAAADLIAGHDQ